MRDFGNRIGIFKNYQSEAVNDMGLDRDLYLNYITFSSSIDHRRNVRANELWRTTRKWVTQNPSLFKPNELLRKPLIQVMKEFERIRKEDSRCLWPQDVGVWLIISHTLFDDYKSRTLKLLESYNYDALAIYKAVKYNPEKKFPFLKGEKILPMWLKILSEDAKVKLQNMETIPLPVDMNVGRVTYNLIFHKEFPGKIDTKMKQEVRETWEIIGGKMNVPVINFDTALWHLGSEGCSYENKDRCKKCTVKRFCYFHSR